MMIFTKSRIMFHTWPTHFYLFIQSLLMINNLSADTDQPTLSKQNIVFIGDSHVGGSFGKKLDGLIRNSKNMAGDKPLLNTWCSCGSSPVHWLKGYRTTCGYIYINSEGVVKRHKVYPTALFKDILRQLKPNLVIISLGSNQMLENLEQSLKDSATLLELLNPVAPAAEILPISTAALSSKSYLPEASYASLENSKASCFWIGPPHMRRFTAATQTEVNSKLKQVVLEHHCQWIDSQNIRYPAKGGDGIHFDGLGPIGSELTTQWALQSFAKLGLISSLSLP